MRSPFGLQVLFKKHDDAGWQLMGQADMRLMGDGGATYLRAHVSHFCCFGCGKRIDRRSGYDQGKYRDQTKVKFVNGTRANLLVVWLPTEFSIESNKRHAVNFSVAAGGVEVGGGGEREIQTTTVMLPAGEIPSSLLVGAHAPKTLLPMRDTKKAERLFVCTIQDEPETTLVTPTVGTPTSPSSTARAHNCDLQRVEYYDSFVVRGGESWALLPNRLETGYQKCRRVRLSDVVLALVPMALAGMTVSGVGEETKEAPNSGFSFFTRRNR